MRMIRYLMVGMAISLAVQPAFARILHVPDEYPTITEAIEASISGDTVLVAPGEHWEDIIPNGKNILITSSQGPDTTIIQGCIIFSHNEDTTCVFRGFTVIGQSDDLYHDSQPAIICAGDCKPKIIGNIIKYNVCSGVFGSGIGVNNSNAIIRHNIIAWNWAMEYGGGINCVQLDDVEISYNIIRNNLSGFGEPFVGCGAGISCLGGRIFYNLIYENEVGPGVEHLLCGIGGGIIVHPVFSDSSSFTYIYNNTIVENIARRFSNLGDGGGIMVYGYEYYDTVIIENNIIAFNHNGGIRTPSSNGRREVIVDYNLFYNNSRYDLWKSDTSETNIFDEDPLLVDTSTHDYNLMAGSPCIDAGNPDYPLDPDSTRVDIGALFYDQSTTIDEDDSFTEQYCYELHQNYPNPFNAQTTISYYLPHDALVSLIVFDITGRIVRNIISDKFQEMGNYSFIWDGKDNSGKEVSTAIYFYQFKINGKRVVKSMIMIK